MSRKTSSEDRGKIKIRFFEVELEGGDETLLEGVRTAAAVASRGATSVRVIKALPSVKDMASHQNDVEDADESLEENGDEKDDTSTTASRNSPKKNRVYPTPEVLDIDLKSEPSLEEFVAKAKPTEDNKKYLVVAAWFKEHRNTPSIGINHIWTCFKALGWGVQKDMGQPFRSMKKNAWFKGSEERGQFNITHVGLDQVQKMNSGT